MPPEEIKAPDTPQPVQEVSSPVSESPAPEVVQSAPEPSPVSVQTTPTPPEPPAEVKTAQPEPPTAHIPANEPLLPPAPVSAVASVANFAHDLAVKARAVIQSRKRKKLEKIMEVVNAKGKITNDQVEKLLHVSDAAATRYLAQLEKEGKVKQEGKTGKGVSYLKL